MISTRRTSEALKPVELHALLALAEGPLHGYALVRRMEEESEGRVRLLPGNLYAILRRLQDRGLVAEAHRPPESGADRRRRYFQLAELGQRALAGETQRLERLLDSVRRRRLVDRGETAS